jgi:uncharacterized protein (DUF952 family)
MLIFKIFQQQEWREASCCGHYDGSDKDRQDGFLHFSTRPQLLGTLQKWYATATDLIVVAVEADTLGPNLRWEPSRNGAFFPHLYGPLPLSAALCVAPIARDAAGNFILPDHAFFHTPSADNAKIPV